MAEQDFRSPLRKLVRWFQRSRDQWKEKYHATKRELKLLKRRYKYLEGKCDRWRERCKQSETRHQPVPESVEPQVPQVEAPSSERAPCC